MAYNSVNQVNGDARYNETLRHLKDREGFEVVGYLPTTSSGVTIGIGIDLGQQTKSGLLTKGISPSIILKLEKYLGYKSKAQLDAAKLKASDLVLSLAEAEALSKPFILESYNAVAPYSINLDNKGNAVLVSLRHWAGSLGCSKCKLSFLVNGVDTNYLWNAIKGKTATNDQIKQALMKTLPGKLPVGTATYNRINHEIKYLG
jgi:hypothetical protein